MISQNPPSPISLYPSLLFFSLLPIPYFFLKIASFLYLGIQAHQWPRKIRTFSAPILEWEISLRRGEGSFAVVYLRLSESALHVRCGEGLHAAAKLYAAAWSASLLRTHGFHCCSSLCFFASILLWYCLASFFIPISTCPIKHYGMGD